MRIIRGERYLGDEVFVLRIVRWNRVRGVQVDNIDGGCLNVNLVLNLFCEGRVPSLRNPRSRGSKRGRSG